MVTLAAKTPNGGQQTTIHQETASQTQDTPEEPTVTRSGRRVRFAKHNDHIYYT